MGKRQLFPILHMTVFLFVGTYTYIITYSLILANCAPPLNQTGGIGLMHDVGINKNSEVILTQFSEEYDSIGSQGEDDT